MSNSAANETPANGMLIQIKQPNEHLPQYTAIVAAPTGTAIHSFELPPNWTEANLDAILSDFRAGISRDRYAITRGKETDVLTPRAFGKELFQIVFAGKVEQLYRDSLLEAQKRGKNLPIRLGIEPKTLARLPWEFLFDPQETVATGYLCFGEETPIIRAFDKKPRIPTFDPPIRLLLVSANPKRLETLDLRGEYGVIDESVAPLIGQNKIEVKNIYRATRKTLSERIRNFKPHIVHFMGHGNVDQLMLEDNTTLDSESLTITLSADRSLRLVILNVCQSGGVTGDDSRTEARVGVARSLAQAGIPGIVAMQFPISDGAAIAFAETFYKLLAEERSVDDAVTWARIEMKGALPAGSLEWATPVLYMQSPHSRLFDDLLKPKEAKSQKTKSQAKPKPEQETEQKEPKETADHKAERIQQIKELLAQLYRNLNRLKLQAAKYGSLDVPTRLSNEIEDTELEIEKLQEELEQLTSKVGDASGQRTADDRQHAPDKKEPSEHQKTEDEKTKIRLDAFYQSGVKHYEAGNWRGAVNLLQTVYDLNPTHSDAESTLRSAEAKLREQETLRRQQSRLKVLFSRAKDLFDDKQWRDALDLLQVIQTDDPTFRAGVIKKMIEDADAKLQRALAAERDQLHWEALYQRAEQAIEEAKKEKEEEEENWTRAIYVLETLEQQSAGYEDVPKLLGEAHRQKMLNDEHKLGQRAFEDKDWDEAVAHFGQVYAWDEAYKDVEQKLGEARREQSLASRYQEGLDFLKAGRWREAIEAFEPIADKDLLRPETRLARRYAKARLAMEGEPWGEAWSEAIETLRELAVAAYRDAGEQLKMAQQEKKWSDAFKRGQKAMRDSKWTEAVTALQTIVKDPDYKQDQARILLAQAQEEANLKRYYLDAQRQLKLEYWAEAIPALEEIRNIRPGGYKNSRTLLTKAKQEKTWAKWYDQAIILTNKEKWKEAIETFECLLKETPDYKDAAERLGNARLQQELHTIYYQAKQAIAAKEWGQAVQLLEQIVDKQADFPNAVDRLNIARHQAELEELYKQGQTHLLNKQWEEAIAAFKKLVEKRNPDDPLDNDYADAPSLRARAHKEKSLADDFQRAKKADESDEYDEAIQRLENILAKAPNHMEGETINFLSRVKEDKKLARIYKTVTRQIAQEQWENAIALLEKILSIRPDYENAPKLLEQAKTERDNFNLYMEANRYANKPDLRAAIVVFEALLARVPDYKDAAQQLAAARRQQDILDNYRDAQKAINQRDWPQAVILLERVVEVQGDFMDAKAKLSIAQRQASLKLLYEKGKEHRQAGQWAEAVIVLEELQPKIKEDEPLDRTYMDASELLAQAREKKYLAETYKQAQEALEIEDWTEAIAALEKIAAKRTDYKDVSTLLERAIRENNFKQAHQAGQTAYNKAGWPTAIKHFTEALKHKSNHRETKELLDEAKRQQAIEETLQEGAKYEEIKDWGKAVEAYWRIIEKLAPAHAEAINSFNRAEKQRNLAAFMAQAEKAVEQKDWDPAIKALNKVVAIDNTYRDAGQELVKAKKQRQLTKTYHQARAALETGQNDFNPEELQSAITLFGKLAPDYKKDVEQQLQIANEELSLLNDFISAERFFKAEDWTGAAEKFHQIADQIVGRRTDYRGTQTYLKDARLNEADREHWYAADKLLKLSKPSDEDLLQAKDELEEIINSGPSAYEEQARLKLEGVAKQLKARLQTHFDEMLALAEAKKWKAALEALEKICYVDIQFKDASNKLKEAMLQAVKDHQTQKEPESALEILRLSKRIDKIIQTSNHKNLL